uniref:Response regulator n=1 Tax=Geoglobus ahangari TaxID=113653 RepID=A0A7C3YF12_9EURY
MAEKKVIVATNSPFMYAMMKRLLQEEGFNLKYVKTGYDLLKAYHELKPDLVLVDTQLEDVSGLDAIKMLLEQDSNAKVVAVSEKKDVDTIVQAIKAGAEDFIAFPITKEDLKTKIYRILAE